MSDENSSQPTVEQIMSRKLVSVGMDDSIGRVSRVLEEHGFHHVLVLEDGRCVGVISDRDLLRTISPFVGTERARSMDEFTANKRVHQVMARSLIWVGPETPIADACRLMVEHDISCLPVLDERQHPLGIATTNDVLWWTAELFEEREAA